MGRVRPGGHNDAGDQRPHPVHDAAAGVRGVHGLRHDGPRLECYVGRVQHLSTTPIALAAIKLTQENLREATYNPKNYKAMEQMVWAQYTAAQAFSTGLLGILHSLSHAVCAYYDIHHGLNNGVGFRGCGRTTSRRHREVRGHR